MRPRSAAADESHDLEDISLGELLLDVPGALYHLAIPFHCHALGADPEVAQQIRDG